MEMATALRIFALVAWAFAVWAVLVWLQSAAAWIGLLVLTVLVGVLVGQWWALLAPVGLAVIWAVAGSLAPDGSDDWDTASYAMVGAIAAVVFALGMAVGVGLTKLVRRPATQRVAGRPSA
jgi:hypothetical protein